MQWLQDVTIRDESTLEVRPNINQKDQPYFAIKHLMEELPQVVIKVRLANLITRSNIRSLNGAIAREKSSHILVALMKRTVYLF